MTSRDFCYWLQGFFEISGKTELTPEQTKMVEKHLHYVFTIGDLAVKKQDSTTFKPLQPPEGARFLSTPDPIPASKDPSVSDLMKSLGKDGYVTPSSLFC